jgi:galactose mutarotase-like enzyme
MLDPDIWNPEALQAHSVDPRQFMDFRQAALPNGTRIIEAYNASGLHFSLLPDRGLDVWTAHFKGVPLTWISQGSPHPPDYGQRWLALFNGGLLTTCGLTHVGAPETDTETGEQRDLHGNFTRLRAQDVRVERDGDTLRLHGTLAEAELYGVQLRAERTCTLQLGHPGFGISDVVTNLGDMPAPLMLLYHFNLGYPLIAQGARLHTASAQVYAGNEVSQAGYDTWPDYAAAAPDYAAQVFFHHPRHDESGAAEAIVYREEFGLSLRWSTATMPYLTQWKNTRQGIYVCGVEPGNCVPEGRNAARAGGRLDMLLPGESRSFGCEVLVLDGSQEVARGINRIYKMRETGQPAPNCKLDASMRL